MLHTVFRSIMTACVPAKKQPCGRSGRVGRRTRDRSMGLESLEQRTALTVSAPSLGLAAASDTGIRGDGITRLVRPVFVGTAAARSSVVVYSDGQLLGVATATARGTWSLSTPVARPLASGSHVITAYAFGKDQIWSTATALSISVDATPPTASLSYDPTYTAVPDGQPTGRLTLTFSEPVQGVRLANMQFRDVRSGFTAALNAPILRSYVGVITTTQLSDRAYAFTPEVRAWATGTSLVTFLKTGVVDRAGNPLAAGVSTTIVSS